MGFFDYDMPNDEPSYTTGPSYGEPSYDSNYDSSNDYMHIDNLIDVTTPSGIVYTYNTLSDAIKYVANNTSYSYDEIKSMLSYTNDFAGYRIAY